jgi:hypothetical protein
MNKNKFKYYIKIKHLCQSTKKGVNHTSYQLEDCYHSYSDKLKQELTNKDTDQT